MDNYKILIKNLTGDLEKLESEIAEKKSSFNLIKNQISREERKAKELKTKYEIINNQLNTCKTFEQDNKKSQFKHIVKSVLKTGVILIATAGALIILPSSATLGTIITALVLEAGVLIYETHYYQKETSLNKLLKKETDESALESEITDLESNLGELYNIIRNKINCSEKLEIEIQTLINKKVILSNLREKVIISRYKVFENFAPNLEPQINQAFNNDYMVKEILKLEREYSKNGKNI